MTQKIVNVSEIEGYLRDIENIANVLPIRALLDKAPSAGNWTDFSIDTTKADYIQIGNIVYFGLKSQGEQHALQEAIIAVASKAFERGRDSVVTAPSVRGEASYFFLKNNETGMVLGVYDNLKSAEWWQKSHQVVEGFNSNIEPVYITPQPDQVAEMQAKIDKLMIEYCPNEMTKEQLDNWAKHQALVTTKD